MQIDIDAEISRCFKRFRAHDPELWNRFLALVEYRADGITVAVTEAPPDQILVAQGRAQEARKFHRLATELPPDPA